MNKKVFFHVGYAKTATTYLQRDIWPRLQGVKYVGRNYAGDDSLLQQFVDHIVFSKSFDFGWSLNTLHSLLQGEESVYLISHEVLLRPGRERLLLERLFSLQTSDVEIHLLVGVRRQEDIIWSRYRHDRKIQLIRSYSVSKALSGGSCSYPRCRDSLGKLFSCRCIYRGYKPISLQHYDYAHLLSLCDDHFGVGRIHFFCYEQIGPSVDLALAPVLNVMGASLPDSFPRGKVNVGFSGSEHDYFSFGEVLRLRRFFSDSNEKLESLTGLPLKYFGYW